MGQVPFDVAVECRHRMEACGPETNVRGRTGRIGERAPLTRLRDLVQGAGDVTIATDLGVPRSTARGWLGKAPKVVVSLDVTDLGASELHQEVLELRRRVKKLTALLRLALAVLRSSGFTLTHERLPDGRARSGSCAPRSEERRV